MFFFLTCLRLYGTKICIYACVVFLSNMSRGKEKKPCGNVPFEDHFPEEKFILMKKLMRVGGFGSQKISFWCFIV